MVLGPIHIIVNDVQYYFESPTLYLLKLTDIVQSMSIPVDSITVTLRHAQFHELCGLVV